MYFIAAQDPKGKYYIEQIENDWHAAVDAFEPEDVQNGKLVIYDDQANKYFVGPTGAAKEKTAFWKRKTAQASQWNFKAGDPYLVDTKQKVRAELQELLTEYAHRHAIALPQHDDNTLEDIVVAIALAATKSHMPASIVEAHKHCADHRKEVQASKICGCFYCLETFAPGRIMEWIDEGSTALCPECGIDAVLGDKSGYPITKAFLAEMHQYWFEGEAVQLGQKESEG